MLQFACLPFQELSLTQLYDIMALRQEVFVVEQNCPYLDADGRDTSAMHLMAFSDEKLAAYARLLPSGIAYSDYHSIGRIVTAPDFRSRGYGKILVAQALTETISAFGNKPIKISAQTYLLDFYRNFGFEVAGSEYLEDGIPHTPMIITLS